MQPVSAADALSLAFTRARAVLAPGRFRAGRFLKLGLLAAFTQATFLSVSITYPLQGGQLALLSKARRMGQQAFASNDLGSLVGALGVGILLVVLGLVVLFSLAYLYVICRCRATLFSLVLTRGASRVRDAWRGQRRSAWRYFGVFLVALLVFWTVMAAVLGPVIVRFVKLMSATRGVDATPQMGSLMLTLAGLVWLLLPVWLAMDALLQDFILPGLVLEAGLPLSSAFSRLGGVFQRAPGQLLLFLVLRAIVAFAMAMALGLVLLIGLGLLALCAGGLGWLLYSLLWSGGLGAHAIFFAVIAGMVLIVLGLYLLGVTAVYGVTGTFKSCYGACFYAGYYPELAARLFPPEPLLPIPSPPEVQPIPSQLW